MAEIRCPMCSKWNPAELDECQYCHARLKPLIAGEPPAEERRGEGRANDAKAENANPAAPADSESPDWLQSLREKQDTTAGEISSSAEESVEPAPTAEVPDWLSRLREHEKEEPPSSETQPESDNDLPAWLSSSASETYSPDSAAAQANSEMPDWLRGMRAEQPGDEPASQSASGASAASPQPGDVPEWLSQLRPQSSETIDTTPPAGSAPEIPAAETGALDVSQPGDSPIGSSDFLSGGVPSWMSDFSTSPASSGTGTMPGFGEEPAAPGEIPDWLQGLGQADASVPAEPSPAQPVDRSFQTNLPPEDLPEWLSNIAGQPAEESSSFLPFADAGTQTPGQEPGPQAQPAETDWLSGFKTEMDQAASSDQAGAPASSTGGETPDWLASIRSSTEMGAEPGSDQTAEPAPKTPLPRAHSGLTGWLGRIDEVDKPLSTTADSTPPNPADEPSVGTPDWLASLQQSGTAPEEPLESSSLFLEQSQPPKAEPVPEKPVTPFVGGDLPDWISDLGPTQSPSAVPASPDEKAGGTTGPGPAPFLLTPASQEPPSEPENLVPAELPSWVQAMRPVESAAPEAGPRVVQENDQRVENNGPLAGLRGILPAEPAAGDYRRPPTYSVKLQVNEAQRRSAQILEDLLASENVPLPAKAERLISSQRIARLAVAIVLIVVVLAGLLGFFTVPAPGADSNAPKEIGDAQEIVAALPDNAPVLLAFDYEPALSGELEAAASGVVSHLMSKNESLILISTTPTGPALAENLFTHLTQGKDEFKAYASGDTKIARLGYLAGGPAAMLEFAQNPKVAAPAFLPEQGKSAWDLPVLQAVQSVRDFKAVVVLTDNVDTGRAWLEQFQPALDSNTKIPFLVVTSAQAAPMLSAYLDSGQVNGMVSGLAGGATYEQLTQNPGPGTQNWSAYVAGMLATLLLILIGGLFNLASGWLNRRKSKEEA